MKGVAERMPRLLALVPYLLARPGIRIDEAASDFGVTGKQLRKDLELLWMCGLPGYGPGDLIDLSFDADTVTVTFDAGMRRPLRLTAAEATALLVALRALAETPGVADAGSVRKAIAKIEQAAGAAGPTGLVVGSGMREAGETASTRDLLQEALTGSRAVRMRYYAASSDQVSDRVADPMRLLIVDGRSYLEAWCRRAEGTRLFRLDRIDNLAVLAEGAQAPPEAEPVDVAEGLFPPRPEQPDAVLVLHPDARWMSEYYACEELAELDGGKLRVLMRYEDESWMIRLVLGGGGDVRVEDPPELAARIHERALEALDRVRHLTTS